MILGQMARKMDRAIPVYPLKFVCWDIIMSFDITLPTDGDVCSMMSISGIETLSYSGANRQRLQMRHSDRQILFLLCQLFVFLLNIEPAFIKLFISNKTLYILYLYLQYIRVLLVDHYRFLYKVLHQYYYILLVHLIPYCYSWNTKIKNSLIKVI